jgi:hypothetical protein
MVLYTEFFMLVVLRVKKPSWSQEGFFISAAEGPFVKLNGIFQPKV